MMVQLRIFLDANVFLAALIPEATKAPKDEILGSARVPKALEEGRLRCVSTAILFGEVRYVYFARIKQVLESPEQRSKRRPACAC